MKIGKVMCKKYIYAYRFLKFINKISVKVKLQKTN